MHVLGLSGSPKRGSMTELLLDRALDGARSEGASAEKVIVNGLVFKPCQACGLCSDTGVCALKDDMSPLYGKLESADALAIASPIFFGSLSAQLKMVIDRAECLWIAKYVLKNRPLGARKRRGIFLCTGGMSTAAYFENAKSIVKIFFKTLDIEYYGDVFFGGLNEKAIDRDKSEDMFAKTFKLGANLVTCT